MTLWDLTSEDGHNASEQPHPQHRPQPRPQHQLQHHHQVFRPIGQLVNVNPTNDNIIIKVYNDPLAQMPHRFADYFL